jgi:hypothetical protein
MASKKQRRRREKLQRHEWELVEIDEEGNETPVEVAARAEKKKESTAKSGGAKARTRRPLREVKPPSWRRASTRALLFAPLLYIFLSIGKSAPPVVTRLGIALLYAAIFVPMFFLVDRFAYRAYRRRVGDS